MELIRDVVFKRNVFGWEEQARIQLYTTYIKQIPFYVVYEVHNSEDNAEDAAEQGQWFLDPNNATKFVCKFAEAFSKNEEFIPSIDMTTEALDALRKTSVHNGSDTMYRVLFIDPEAEISAAAMGPMAWNKDLPWFVSADCYDTARYCIYTEHVATCVARMNAAIRINGYVNSRVMGCSGRSKFVVESAPYHPSGVSDDWQVFEEFPVWNQRVAIDFNESATDIEYRYLTDGEIGSFIIKDKRILQYYGLIKELN